MTRWARRSNFGMRSRLREFPDGIRDLIGGGPFDLLPGQVTDDTELALALTRSLVKEKKYDDDAVAASYGS